MTERARTAIAAVVATAALALAPSALAGTWERSMLLPTTGLGDSDHLSLFADGTGFDFHQSGGVQNLYRTTDGGRSWTQVQAPPFTASGAARFVSPAVGFGVSNGELLRTTDAGATWAPRPVPEGPAGTRLGTEIEIGTAGNGRTVGISGRFDVPGECDTDEPARIFTSHDGGETWRNAPIGATGSVADLRYLDDTHGIAMAYDLDSGERCDGGASTTFRVYATRDGGASWQEVFQCADEPCTTTGIAAPGVLFVGSHSGHVHRSEDGGATWTTTTLRGPLPTTAETSPAVRGIDFADDSTGYAYVSGAGMFRTVDGGRTWTRERSFRTLHQQGVGEVAAAGEHALAGGPFVIERRVP